jgi:hypothetical protein
MSDYILCDDVDGLKAFAEHYLALPEHEDDDRWWHLPSGSPFWVPSTGPLRAMVPGIPVRTRLGRDLLMRWLAEGEQCCTRPPGCTECDGNGYIRKPHDVGWARDIPEALAENVRRVARGEEPLRGVLGD